jgi:Raf kinase inhibitor-like YbhB/YbcL family protein
MRGSALRYFRLFIVLFPFLAGGGLFRAQPAQGGEAVTLTITSSAFKDGGEIPARYTYQGEDISPPLAWSGLPQDVQSLVLIVDDPDVPDPAAPERTWVHWVLYNIPPSVTGLPEGVKELPKGVTEGVNDWKRKGYGGPHPPIGRHRYFFKLYALNTKLQFGHPPTKAEVEEAIWSYVLSEATLMGTYQLKK